MPRRRPFLDDDSDVTGRGRKWLPKKPKPRPLPLKPHRPPGWRRGRTPGWRDRPDPGLADTFPKHLRKKK